VERLDLEGRIEEVARMIGGATITEHTRASARELLDEARTAESGERRKAKAKVRG
jgi:DNA repair ATPase RecN